MNRQHQISTLGGAVLALAQLTANATGYAYLGNESELGLLYGDPALVSIATGTRKPIHKAPSTASVISQEDIARSNAQTLVQLLEQIPGIHVSQSQFRLDSIVTIRGFRSDFNPEVLTLINGVPINTVQTGGRVFFFRYPIHNIQRIEIIRGPGSAIYGADAYSGVINIITKSGKNRQVTEMGSRYGTFDSGEIWGNTAGAAGDWSYFFGIDRFTTNGDDDRRITADAQTGLDALFGNSASHAPGILNTGYASTNIQSELANEHWTFRANLMDTADAGYGPGIGQALDPGNTGESRSILADISYDRSLSEEWSIEANAGFFGYQMKNRFTILPPGTVLPIGADGNVFQPADTTACPPARQFPPGSGTLGCLVDFPDGLIGYPEVEEQQYSANLIGFYEGLRNHRLRIAAGVNHIDFSTREQKNFGPGVSDSNSFDIAVTDTIDGTLTDVSGTPYVFAPNASRTSSYLSLQDEWLFAADWELTAGFRYDHFSDFGSTINPRFAVVWQTGQNLTSKLLYGRAFRAPSYNETLFKNNPVALGNSSVDPERVETLELAFDYRPRLDMQLGLNTFGYETKDKILFLMQPGTTENIARNTEGSHGFGAELEFSWQVNPDLKLYANASWLNATNKRTDTPLEDVPGRQFYSQLQWRPSHNWQFAVDAKWVGGFERTPGDPRAAPDDYWLSHMTVQRRDIIQGLDVALQIRNLFDTRAHEPSPGPDPGIAEDYPLEGRSIMLELRYLL